MLVLCSALSVPLILNVRFYFTNPRDMDYKSYSGGCMNACVRARSPHNICCRDVRTPTSSARVLHVVASFVLPMTACCSYMGAFVSSWVCLCCCLRTLCCSEHLHSFMLLLCNRSLSSRIFHAGSVQPHTPCISHASRQLRNI